MEYRTMKPKQTPKVKKIVYIDIKALQEQPGEDEKNVIAWLTAYFDVYIVQTDEFIHLLRGDYLISPVDYSPMFHGEWLSFRLKTEKDHDSPQMDWLQIKDYFMGVVEKNENVDYADSDMTVLSMLRSQMRFEDEQEK